MRVWLTSETVRALPRLVFFQCSVRNTRVVTQLMVSWRKVKRISRMKVTERGKTNSTHHTNRNRPPDPHPQNGLPHDNSPTAHLSHSTISFGASEFSPLHTIQTISVVVSVTTSQHRLRLEWKACGMQTDTQTGHELATHRCGSVQSSPPHASGHQTQ